MKMMQNVIICLGPILDKGLHIIHPKWKLPVNLMNLLLKSTLKGHIHGTYYKGHIRIDFDPQKIQVQ
jgi:hypothetical protein